MIRAALSLSQLTTLVGNTIRLRPELQHTWVTAELSDVRSSGGHCYMELVEKNQAGATMAKIKANIWSNVYARLNRTFFEATGRPIASGIKVLVCGSVTYHNLYGLSFNISDIDPTYTLGDMERLRREILAALEREGLADANKQRPLPLNPQRIAVISAAGAAGYGDFCRQLEENAAGFVFYPHLFPAVMQGERTAESVMSALEYVEMTIDLWDCVVIIRGGGSTTDLGGFDDLALARAVARCPLPVIVGIGHERDNTVLDYIAHTRCKTPTAVAEFLIESLRNAAATTATLVNNIIRYATERIKGEERRLSALTSMIPAIGTARLREARVYLDSLATTLPISARAGVTSGRQNLTMQGRMLATVATSRIETERLHLEMQPQRLRQGVDAAMRRENDRLESARRLLDVLSPTATLRRGYSITRVDGRAVSSASQLSPGAVMTTTLAHGTVISTILTNEKNQKS